MSPVQYRLNLLHKNSVAANKTTTRKKSSFLRLPHYHRRTLLGYFTEKFHTSMKESYLQKYLPTLNFLISYNYHSKNSSFPIL